MRDVVLQNTEYEPRLIAFRGLEVDGCREDGDRDSMMLTNLSVVDGQGWVLTEPNNRQTDLR